MTGERFFVDHLLALRAFLLCKRALLLIRIRFAMPFHMLVEAGAVKLVLAIRTQASMFEFWLWTSSTALPTTTWMLAVAWQRMQMRMPRLAHFYSVGDIGQKKETCSGGDGFFCVRGCCAYCSL